MRIAALIATYNEERVISACLEHLFEQGIEAYIIDNSSADKTSEICKGYLGRGVLGVETFPRAGVYSWRPLLERKEELAASLDADWFLHMDPDEIRLPPSSSSTLREAFAEVDEAGYNAVNFIEFTFVPTRESPEHDHPNYVDTMRWYYPFLPRFVHGLKGWKRQPERVELAWSAGHEVRFPGLRVYPTPFRMKHYPFLSRQHAIDKYVTRRFDEGERRRWGWHEWRGRLGADTIELPSESELRLYVSDDELDGSEPRSRHYVAGAWYRSRQKSP